MSPPVRVLHLVKGLGPGGAERLLVTMANARDRQIVDEQVAYLLPWKQHLVSELRQAEVPVHLLAGTRGMADPRWVRRLRRLVTSERIDVVHMHSPAVASIARPALRLLPRSRRPALVSTEHNVWGSHALPTRIANAATLPLDSVRLAVSGEVKASMWPAWRAGTEVVIYGVPVDVLSARRDERAESRAELGVDDADVVVTVVANLRANKDYPNLFDAANRALIEEPSLRFLAVGQGPLETQLRKDLSERGLGDRFVMLGYHPDPARVLVASDVFTLSSRHEGLPIAMLEAMAVGLPVVATDVGGVGEVVTADVEGVLVPASDPRSLSSAFVRLARDQAMRDRMGAAAARRAEDFDVVRSVRQIEHIYREIVVSREARTRRR